MKALTNSDVLYLGAVLPGTSMIFLAHTLKDLKNYKLQKTVALNEPLILAESNAIYQSMVKTLGEGFDFNSPEALEILKQESGLELKKTKLTDEYLESLETNREEYFCLMCIREEEN